MNANKRTNQSRRFRQYVFCVGLALGGLHGCAALTSGGAATTAIINEDRRSLDTIMTDKKIVNEGKLLLRRMPQDSNVHLHAHNGTVLLYGQVSNQEDAKLAQNLLSPLREIKRIQNEIVIGPTTGILRAIGDSTIGTAVRAALLASVGVPDGTIDVVTKQSTVYLMGRVTKAEGERAASVAASTPGVDKVIMVFDYLTDEERLLIQENIAKRKEVGGN